MNVNNRFRYLWFVCFFLFVGCSHLSSSSINYDWSEFLQRKREIPSAFPLSYYHNRVVLIKTGLIYDSNYKYSEPKPYDSCSYRDHLLEYSTTNDTNVDALLIKGDMVIDSIIEGMNVDKIIVDFNGKKYIVFSLCTRTRSRGKIMEGKTYYLELLPYYYPDSEDYNNAGLYYKGLVIEDMDLPIYEWKKVCTTKCLDGIYYNSRCAKSSKQH